MTRTRANDDMVMRLVEETLARPEPEREGFLRQECDTDADLFDEVKRRVELELRMGRFLLEPLMPRPDFEHPFQPGDVLNGRFRLVREISHGGMGVVYEAMDERLEKRIAIKCARPGYQKHLPPEVIFATEIKHRNVCDVYDLHQTETPHGAVDFLTMEYLEGETLAQRLERGGGLPLDEACEILRQICEGLEEAHQKVVHGDLKTSNVILTNAGGNAPRPVITDFGLARQIAGPVQSTALLAASGGTPAYTAPERWSGAKASVASDIYALGVMFYEMLMGHLPPRMRNSEAHYKYNLKLVRKEMGAAGHRLRGLLLSCLDADPARRPASAIKIAKTISAHKRARRLVVGFAAAAVLLISGPLLMYQPQKGPIRLAVLPFVSTPEQHSLAKITLQKTTDLLRHAERGRTGFSVIPVSESMSSDVDSIDQACTAAGATHVLVGQVQQERERLTVEAKVLSACSQQALKEVALEYSGAETADMAPALSGVVTGALHITPVMDRERVSDPDYVAGLQQLDNESEVDSAIKLLARATRRQSQSAAVWAALAEAYRLKYKTGNEEPDQTLAVEAAKRAQSLNPDSAPVCRIEGLLHLDAGSYARAADDFGRAIELASENPDGYLGLARAYKAMDRIQEALQTISKAIQVAPRYAKSFEQLGGVYYDLGKFDKSAQEFKKAVELNPKAPEPYIYLAAALTKLGRYPEAEQSLRFSLGLKETLDAHVDLGAALAYECKFVDAIAQYQRAVELSPKDYLSWMNLAENYRRTNQHELSERDYQRALSLARQEVLRNPQVSDIHATVAYILARLGQAEPAEYELRQALQLPRTDAEVLRTAALTYCVLGKKKEFRSVLDEAPTSVRDNLKRQPDMADVCSNLRFTH